MWAADLHKTVNFQDGDSALASQFWVQVESDSERAKPTPIFTFLPSFQVANRLSA